MHWRLEYSTENSNVAIFVSLYLHCVVAIIIANHTDAEVHAKFHGIPFHLSSINGRTRPMPAVRWHLQHRILSYANKAVIFD